MKTDKWQNQDEHRHNGKITRIYSFFMLVMIKAILYEKTVAVCASMDFGQRFGKI